MVILDMEVFYKDWTMYFIDTAEQQGYYIVNNRDKLQKFYDKYKDKILIGYNITHFDQYIIQAILAGFDPYEVTQWIIVDEEPGWKYSELLRRFPLVVFDVMQPNKGLKQCEASLGMAIVESTIPFNIQRKLTNKEIREVLIYNKADVWATFEVFLQDGFYLSPQSEFQASMGIIQEFNFPKWYMSKTKSQMGVSVLGARKTMTPEERVKDEFDILNPTNLQLGKYEYVREWFLNPENHWYYREVEGRKSQLKNELKTEIAGLEHVFAWGGVHGSRSREIIDGTLLLLDFSSLYPNIMVEYDLVSRGVPNPKRYKELLETRMKLKAEGNDRQESYKIALNGSYGQMKFKSSALYDPKMANNVCVHGQLIALDLIEKIEDYGEIINSNTDGVLIKVHSEEYVDIVTKIADEVAKRVRIEIGIDRYKRFIVKDVNNYIAVEPDGKVIAKGGYVKYKSPLEMNYNIINHSIREYFVNNVPVRDTIMNCDELLQFQIISNAGGKYKYAMYGDTPITERVNRVFASTDSNDKGIFKLHKETGTKAKIEMTPEKCFIDNGDIIGKPIPAKLDREWYIELAERRVKEFVK